MLDLLSMQKQFLLSHIKEGDSVADFTMGNGYDTVFLSKTVGETGSVTAFDIQPAALESTSANLRRNGCPENWHLICASHDRGGRVQSRISPGIRKQSSHNRKGDYSSRSTARHGYARRKGSAPCSRIPRSSRRCRRGTDALRFFCRGFPFQVFHHAGAASQFSRQPLLHSG